MVRFSTRGLAFEKLYASLDVRYLYIEKNQCRIKKNSASALSISLKIQNLYKQVYIPCAY